MMRRIQEFIGNEWLHASAQDRITNPMVRFLRSIYHTLNAKPERELISRIQEIERRVQETEAKATKTTAGPVVFFNPSCFLAKLNLNGAASLITSWALRLSGQSVLYYFCNRGLSQCLLGSRNQTANAVPPCDMCVSFRRQIYPEKYTRDLIGDQNRFGATCSKLESLPWEDLLNYSRNGLDLAELCLPSLRWTERRSNLTDTFFSRHVLSRFISSAELLAADVLGLINKFEPSAFVLFNGSFFPEATVRTIAVKKGIRVVTYESGYGELTTFFSHGTATEYAIGVPQDFIMGERENRELDDYIAFRQGGRFTMAGRRQWPEMQSLTEELRNKIGSYSKIVSIFTNTPYDTSQLYANSFFTDMFDWLRTTLEEAKSSPNVLFIVRAHPDEMRTGRESKETVAEALEMGGYSELPNVLFIESHQRVSSYELVAASHACLVYNSIVGLEAAVMGKFVIAGGVTRYRNENCCYNIANRNDYLNKLREVLSRDEPLMPPLEWQDRARRYLYYSTFHGYMRFSDFVKTKRYPSIELTIDSAEELLPENSQEMRIIIEGIIEGRDFRYPI